MWRLPEKYGNLSPVSLSARISSPPILSGRPSMAMDAARLLAHFSASSARSRFSHFPSAYCSASSALQWLRTSEGYGGSFPRVSFGHDHAGKGKAGRKAAVPAVGFRKDVFIQIHHGKCHYRSPVVYQIITGDYLVEAGKTTKGCKYLFSLLLEDICSHV